MALLLGLVLIGMRLRLLTLAGPLWKVVDVLATPANLFGEWIAEPLLEAWDVGHNMALTFTVGLGLWELAALLVGLAVYGGALLVHAIVGEPGREGEGNSDG